MTGKMIARPNKNEFLLYTMLDVLGLTRGNPDTHFLRRKTLDHFQGYKGLGLKETDYVHHSKPVFFVLAYNDMPNWTLKPEFDFESLSEAKKSEFEIGSMVAEHLRHFYETTDFEEFYQGILPRYKEECKFVQGILERTGLKKIVDEAWELTNPLDIEVIPMPLESIRSGIGPSWGNTAFPVVGPPFDGGVVHNVAHEASHPSAKRVLASVREHIKEYEHLFAIAMSHPNWPESYTNWQTCFEEHFIRAMQTGYINPLLNLKLDIQAQLQAEKSWKGMVFVNDMYDEIRAHKEQAQGSLQDVVHIILGRLDKKYQSDKVVKDVARELRRDSDYLESIRDYVARMRLDTSQKSSEWRRRTPAQIIKSEYVNGCTDVALVFIALARELGIPATYVETFEKSTQDPNFDKSRGHIFVDVSIRRKWIRYDPTNGPTLEGKNIVDGREYVEFGKGLDFFEVYPLKRGVYHGNPINMQNLDNLNLNR